MPSKTINIYKSISGSLPQADKFGDGRLLYSEGISTMADNISSMFMDSQGRLSDKYATIIWTYYDDIDRYVFTNIQGHYTVFEAEARAYPYRATFEVDRDDLNSLATEGAIAFRSLFDAMPRIRQIEQLETAGTATTIAPRSADSMYATEAEALADRIVDAIAQQKRLYIALDTEGRTDLQAAALQDSAEMLTIASALELLPPGFARYATFALCFDDKHLNIPGDILIYVYVKGRFTLPDGAKSITWSEATKPIAQPQLKRSTRKALNIASTLPGAKERLIGLDIMASRVADINRTYDSIQQKDPTTDCLTETEWPTWLLEHKIGSVACHSWTQLKQCVAKAPAAVRRQLLEQHKQEAAGWKLSTDMQTLLPDMGFDAKVFDGWRCSILAHYLYDASIQHKYGFLFADGTFDFARHLNSKFVEKLAPSPASDKAAGSKPPTFADSKTFYDKWMKIFGDHKALNEATLTAFAAKYDALPFQKITQIIETLKMLNKTFPDIRITMQGMKARAKAFVYKKLDSIPALDSSDYKGLTDEQKAWVKAHIESAYQQCRAEVRTLAGFLDLAAAEAPTERQRCLLALFGTADLAAMIRTGNALTADCEALLTAATGIRKRYGKKHPAADVCHDTVLTTLIAKLDGAAITPGSYPKWDAINAQCYADDDTIAHPLTWQVLHGIFDTGIAEIDKAERLAKVLDDICSYCTPGQREQNTRHRRFAKAVIQAAQQFTNIKEETRNTMEEKYKHIFTSLDKDAASAVKAEDKDATDGTATDGTMATICATARELWQEKRPWLVGLAALLVVCLTATICYCCGVFDTEKPEVVTGDEITESNFITVEGLDSLVAEFQQRDSTSKDSVLRELFATKYEIDNKQQ